MDYQHPDPIDMVAVRVTRCKGEHYEFTIRDQTTDFLPDIKQVPLAFGIKDYSGVKYDGMTVLCYIGQNGKSKRHPSNERHMWAVECKCGRIVKRQSKSISKALRFNKKDMCIFCAKISNFRLKQKLT